MKPFSTERSPSIFSTVFIHSSLTKKTHRDAWNHFPLSVHQAFFPLYSFTQFLLRRRIVMHETIPLSVHQTFFPLFISFFTKKTHRDAWNHFPLRRRIVMHETIFHWAFTKHFFHYSFTHFKKTHRDAWNHFPLSVHQTFFPLFIHFY